MSRVSAKVLTASAIVAAVAGAWVVYTFPPGEHSFYPRCVFHAMTGLQCPGCGSTRALHHLLHGRIAEAWRFNLMLFAMIFTGIFAMPSVARGTTPSFLQKPWFAWTALAVVVGWGVLRNVM